VKHRFSVFFIIIMFAMLFCASCSINTKNEGIDKLADDKLVNENNNVLSPSGEYSLEMAITIQNNVRGFNFIVKKSSVNEIVFESNEFFRLRDETYLFWGDDNTIWVYSGDVGTLYWEKSSGLWTKKIYADNKEKVKVPELLKRLKPQYFN